MWFLGPIRPWARNGTVLNYVEVVVKIIMMTLILQSEDQKRFSGRLLLTGKRWVVWYTIYPFFTAAPLSVIFKTTSV